MKTSPFTIRRRNEVLLFIKIAFIKLQHDLLTFRMSRRESWDSTTWSKAVSAQAWRFWHEISGATCRLTPDSGCCTRRKVQDSRGWFGKCSHNSFTDTSYEALKERISRLYPVSNNAPFAASHSNGTKQDRHAGEKKTHWEKTNEAN